MSGNDHRGSGDTAADALRTVVLAFGIASLLAIAVALIAAVRTVQVGPKVGDILVFRSDMTLPADWGFSVVTQSNDLPVSCTLKPSVMAAGGGSLVVEQRSVDKRRYRVHWAGRRTDHDADDCGTTADLVLGRSDLQVLSNVVGGPGVERRRPGWF